MEWYVELYDDFRRRTGFGAVSPERTRQDVDFIIEECGLRLGHKVLDLCAGTGRHSIELESRGLRTVAVELNRDYAKLANVRARAVGVRLSMRVGDVRVIDFGEHFDAAILMWNSFGYFSDDENAALLAKVRAALKPGRRFLIEVLSRDYLLRTFEGISEREVDGVTVREEREFDLVTSRMRSVITRFEGSHAVTRRTDWRLYSLHELSNLGQGVGLDLVAAYGDLERNPVHLDTRLMRLVFERFAG